CSASRASSRSRQHPHDPAPRLHREVEGLFVVPSYTFLMSSRIIAVVGAAGSQGGSVARAILADDDRAFSLRALTRRPQSERAQALARLGAEVVYADVDDLESLKAAFAGAYGAYCMTDFW